MNENFLEIDALKTDRELHNEKIKLLAFKIIDETDNIKQALKYLNLSNHIFDSYVKDIATYSDIIVELATKEMKK